MCSQQQVLQKKKLGKIPSFFHLEVTPGFEPGNEGFADPCLTPWLCHHMILSAQRLDGYYNIASPPLSRGSFVFSAEFSPRSRHAP